MARTVVDLARVFDEHQAADLLRQAVRLHCDSRGRMGVDLAGLEAELGRQAGRPGIRYARAAVASIDVRVFR